MAVNNSEEARIALFIDFENIALGLRGKKSKSFNIHRILERLLEEGRIIAKRAYADWSRYSDYKGNLHEAAIELIEIPKRVQTGKNSADIRLVVDALDLCYTKEHLDTFVVMSGDSDFSPLVSKLKENNKRVIGIGLRDATSNLLAENCDEFLECLSSARADLQLSLESIGESVEGRQQRHACERKPVFFLLPANLNRT